MYKIAIDGPSGVGKSTLAKSLSRRLGFIYVDTGALYRAVGLYAYDHGIGSKDATAIEAMLGGVQIELKYADGAQRVMLCGLDVTGRLREPQISMYASDVSALPCVRAFLLGLQRDIAANNNVVMDGRDIGTVIMPDAQVKIFLTATPGSRAKRRYEQLISEGRAAVYEDVRREMALRDANDSSRAAAPLVRAADAIAVDSSEFEPEQTLQRVLEIIRGRCGEIGVL